MNPVIIGALVINQQRMRQQQEDDDRERKKRRKKRKEKEEEMLKKGYTKSYNYVTWYSHYFISKIATWVLGSFVGVEIIAYILSFFFLESIFLSTVVFILFLLIDIVVFVSCKDYDYTTDKEYKNKKDSYFLYSKNKIKESIEWKKI